MSDLRKAAEAVLDRWDSPAWEWMKQGPTAELMATLRTALAAPSPEPEPVALAHCPYTPPPSAHFGYVLGDHWLETAYSRVLDGEAEAEVLKDCGWERVTDAEALRQDAERYRWMTKDDTKYETRRRVRNILSLFNAYAYRKEHIDAAIDAAMQKGDKT
jgi:hypothetical protein